MCNRYSTPEIAEIEREWEIGRRAPNRWWRPSIGPMQDGPFVRAQGELAVGQWTLIPDGSGTPIPQDRNGRRLSTNNTRREKLKIRASIAHPIWSRGQRCLIPAVDFDEPYWGTGANIWWRFARADGKLWALGGLWNDWIDPATGEVVSSYSMLTQNCDAHPLLKLMHKPERDKNGNVLPPEKQDKRAVVPIEREHWDQWLHGTPAQADALIQLPALEVFAHGAADPAKQVPLPL